MKLEKRRRVAAIHILSFSVLILTSAVHSTPLLVEEAETDSLRKKRSGFTVFPIVFRSPETKWAGGTSVNYYYRHSENQSTSRPSTISPTLIYTQKKQIISTIGVDLWGADKYNLTASGGFIRFPDTFYGIGTNTSADMAEDYTQRIFFLGLGFQKQVRKDFYLGVNYQFGHGKMMEVERDGLLASGNISGSEGGVVSGAGVSVNLDTRNNLFYPTAGGIYGFSITFYRRVLGSDFDFIQYSVGLRKYVSLFSAHVLAFQGVMAIRTGDPPFQVLSQLGGILRGYTSNRYIDKNLLAAQVEYRMPVWWRFGLVGFAGFGDVASKITDFEPTRFKHSVGWGIRYLFSRDEGINLRVDFGYGKDSSAFYINYFEAF